MGMTLIAEDIRVEQRFEEIVAGIREDGAVSAKLRPYEDPEASPTPERQDDGTEGDSEESDGESDGDQRDSQDDREQSSNC